MNQTAKFTVTIPADYTGQIRCGVYECFALGGQVDLNSFRSMLYGAYPGVPLSIENPNADAKVFDVEWVNVVQCTPDNPPNGHDPDGTPQLAIGSDVGPVLVEIIRRNVYEPAE